MPVPVLSDSWVKELTTKMNGNPTFQQKAGGMNMNIAIVATADSSVGSDHTLSAFIKLVDGKIVDGKALSPDEVDKWTDLKILGTASAWKDVLDRTTDPMFAVAMGDLKLEGGDLGALLPYLDAAVDLLNDVLDIDATYPWTGPGWDKVSA